MPLPEPEPGLVIQYQFRWSHESDSAHEERRRRRPCIIISTTKTARETTVTVAPITTVPPQYPDEAIEVPQKVRDHLRLDAVRSWIKFNELNMFSWPGLYVFPLPIALGWNKFDYGYLPPKFFEQVKNAILALDASRKNLTIRTG